MNAFVEVGLSFLLFLPLFSILGALYWMFPRQPRSGTRRLADAAVLIAAVVFSIIAVRWGFFSATREGGTIWPQVLASLACFVVFSTILAVAFGVRAWCLRQR